MLRVWHPMGRSVSRDAIRREPWSRDSLAEGEVEALGQPETSYRVLPHPVFHCAFKWRTIMMTQAIRVLRQFVTISVFLVAFLLYSYDHICLANID